MRLKHPRFYALQSALLGVARASALDLGKFGITVNCIASGPFLTELILRNFTQEARQKFADRTALGRLGDPEELAGPVLLLASEAGGYITGACPVVDGGTIVKTLQTNKRRTQLVAYLTNQGDIPLKHSKIKRRTL
jgi:NAD(P)-dependent dehydrogenase (short-subunit alcohol dehydrogenase family)